MSSRTYTEAEVQDLTDRVFLLKQQLIAGKIRFLNQDLEKKFRQSYEAIRLRPDGKVDPTTVDGRIRASTLSFVAMRQRETAKKSMSLAQIQVEYFEFLFSNFGFLYDIMKSAHANPFATSEVIAKHEEPMNSITQSLPDIFEKVKEFWSSVIEVAGYHLQDSRQLKAIFAGDIFPPHWENAVSTAGLYVDTIILPCPIIRLGSLVKAAPPREVVKVLIKHILTAMTYRDIALADVQPPIAMIVPNIDDVLDDERGNLIDRATPAICAHAKSLFNRTFGSIEELQEFCLHLKTVEQLPESVSSVEFFTIKPFVNNNLRDDKPSPGRYFKNAL